jgi:hypothetical protein
VAADSIYTVNGLRDLRRASRLGLCARRVRPQQYWRRCRDERKLLRRNVIINGDDCLFVAPDDRFLEIHSGFCQEVSLRSSKGKDYRSRHGCLINSQFFQLKDHRMTRVGYLNQRFIFGSNIKKKSSDGTNTVKPTDIARDINKMVSLTPWTSSASPACLERLSREVSRKDSVRPNWYLPVHLGGFGLDPRFGPQKLWISKQQRILAAQFIHDPELTLYRSKGVLPAPKQLKFLAPQPRIVVGDYVANSDETEELEDPWGDRMAFHLQCHRGLERVQLQKEFEIRSTSITRDYRLKPVGLENLLSYWRFSRVYYDKWNSECPPLGKVNLRGGFTGDLGLCLTLIGLGKFSFLASELLDIVSSFL